MSTAYENVRIRVNVSVDAKKGSFDSTQWADIRREICTTMTLEEVQDRLNDEVKECIDRAQLTLRYLKEKERLDGDLINKE